LPSPGDTLAGKYQLIRKLGEGGMGVVYEAVHTRIQQRVAIKMLLPEVMELPEVVPRFEREARAAGKLRSDNTARVLDVDLSENGLPYMVMEFLDGTDLGKVLETQGALPVHEAVDYVLQACNAMAEAHAEGVIHRDLKPSNLFLTIAGATRKIKVLDFGISKLENDKEARVTATQAVVGTPLYMSPEQVRSAKHVDARSDIWSLGIILYELVTGRTPFEGSTTAAAAAICIDDPPPIGHFRQGVPPDLERAILMALQKEPSARFANVQLLAQAIAPFGTGAIAAPDTAPAFQVPPSISSPRLPPYSRPELGSAPTIHHSDHPSGSGARAAANPHTLPGWTTRSSPGKRRSKTILTVVITAVLMLVGAGVVGLVLNFTKHKTPEPAVTMERPTATVTAAPPVIATATETATATATITTSGLSSTAVPSTRSTNSRPRPTATATTTATSPPTATHTTAPAPTRL
jgi:serine/threonine-protein kinase